MIILLFFFIPILPDPISAGPIGSTTLCTPEPGTFWHGAFAPERYHRSEMDVTNASIATFNRASGNNVNIAAFSHEWGINRSFPTDQFTVIHDTGAVPWIRLMLRSDIGQYRPEPIFTLNRIRDGVFDDELRSWARHARDLGYPVIIEYGTEVNGKWFSWNGYWTGENGADIFRETYQHIIRIMKDEGAHNLIWVYHVNWNNNPDEPWNTYAAYYPGDEYIDMLAVSAYGALSPDATGVLPFADMIDIAYGELSDLNPEKPIIIAETGTDLKSRTTPADNWVEQALRNLTSEKWPRIIGFVWWNANWPNDNNPAHNTTMRIEEDNKIGMLFQKTIGGDDRFIRKLRDNC
ncbi:MAG TPA: glycosyl hydrolase [Methanospirillum sp.]|nr:glycosyl hydrolase [Methanospirillum sp.]